VFDVRLAELIRATERERLRSLIAPDLNAARSLHADDYQLVTPGGATLSKEDYLGQIESGALDYRTFEPQSELAVRCYGQAAIVRYRVHIEVGFGDGRDAGEFWHTDLYELRDGRWQAVWSQATRIR
jgi:hypothetical protein